MGLILKKYDQTIQTSLEFLVFTCIRDSFDDAVLSGHPNVQCRNEMGELLIGNNVGANVKTFGPEYCIVTIILKGEPKPKSAVCNHINLHTPCSYANNTN